MEKLMSIKYKIESINPNDSKALADVIYNAFSKKNNEEINTDFKEYIEYLCFLSSENRLGYLVRCVETKSIIGGVLCGDLADYFKSEAYSTYAEHDPYAALIKALNIKYFQGEVVTANTYLSIQFIALMEEFSGNGIASSLVEKALMNAERKGFCQAHVESAGSSSQHIFGTKLLFPTVAEIKYADFVFKNEKPLQTNISDESVKLMIKDLRVK